MGQGNSQPQPQPGDLIEIDRQLYQHWAIYVGKGYVIHVTDEGDSSVLGSSASVAATRAKVKKELLEKVVGNNKWCVNKKYDRSYKPRPIEEIIQRAEEWVGEEVEYNLLTNNCEHFVTELRYGVGVSEQAEKVVPRTTRGGNILYGFAGVLSLLTMVLSKVVPTRQFD